MDNYQLLTCWQKKRTGGVTENKSAGQPGKVTPVLRPGEEPAIQYGVLSRGATGGRVGNGSTFKEASTAGVRPRGPYPNLERSLDFCQVP